MGRRTGVDFFTAVQTVVLLRVTRVVVPLGIVIDEDDEVRRTLFDKTNTWTVVSSNESRLVTSIHWPRLRIRVWSCDEATRMHCCSTTSKDLARSCTSEERPLLRMHLVAGAGVDVSEVGWKRMQMERGTSAHSSLH